MRKLSFKGAAFKGWPHGILPTLPISQTQVTDLVFRLTGHGSVESEGLEAGELFASGLLHAVTEDVLPGVQLQQLDAL